MSKERYNEIVDEVYKQYVDSHWIAPIDQDGDLLADQLWSVIPVEHNKETFVNEIKCVKEFSEKWRLQIEERDLTLEERNELLNKKTNRNHKREDCFSDEEFERETQQDCKVFNIPTKEITIKYNNETIKITE